MRAARVLLAWLLVSALGAATAEAAATVTVQVLSNRADLISAGDALVALDLPTGATNVRVTLNGQDISNEFARREDGRFVGLVESLKVGRNVVVASARGAKSGSATIVNHPNGGPVFSGPQVQPWTCQEGAVDEQCNQPATYDFFYKPTGGTGFQPYDPENPPSDVATTTTDQGKAVPYIVRVETGYQARDQYKIAALYDPAKPWTSWAPQKGWNHKLLITHGASCGIERVAGTAPDVMKDFALSRGFAVGSTALNNSGHNCNLVTQAESIVMMKERLVEQYGELRYTIGTGGSGGALAQHWMANAFPGLYQGILPAASFPDASSTGQQLVGYNLLRAYHENPAKWAPGVTWDPVSIGLVEGHPNHVNSIVFDTLFWTDLGVPDDSCVGVAEEDVYDPATNPAGIRCTLSDYAINAFGVRGSEEWGPVERELGRGFANLPFDQVGVQFGLDPLEKGLITPAQFVDLNAKVGGRDIDVRPIAARTETSSAALRNAYRTGLINRGNHLDKVAIIDLRGPDPGAFHDAYRSWAVRARLEREQGAFPKNHVIWFGNVPLAGDPGFEAEAFVAMDRWLAAVEADQSDKPLARKIQDLRPTDVQDRCSNLPGFEMVDVPGAGRVCENDQIQTRYGTPNTVAGESVATDTNKCALKPLRRSDYYPIAFTDAQWAQLESAFPTGVCDWSRPGPEEQDTIAWQTYQEEDGEVVYGGKPLGKAPAGSGLGWTSAAFDVWRMGSAVPALGDGA